MGLDRDEGSAFGERFKSARILLRAYHGRRMEPDVARDRLDRLASNDVFQHACTACMATAVGHAGRPADRFYRGVLIPSIMAWRSASANSFFAKQLAAIDYLLPKTPSQRVLFLLVSVTAGICEEVIFRAFAIHYLATVLPGASIRLCVILAALLFGIIHVGQGARGVISTGILGAVVGAMYVGFGVLWDTDNCSHRPRRAVCDLTAAERA